MGAQLVNISRALARRDNMLTHKSATKPKEGESPQPRGAEGETPQQCMDERNATLPHCKQILAELCAARRANRHNRAALRAKRENSAETDIDCGALARSPREGDHYGGPVGKYFPAPWLEGTIC